MNFRKQILNKSILQRINGFEKILQIGLVILIFVFMGQHLIKNYARISKFEWSINYSYLMLSIILVILVSFAMAGVWQSIIRTYAPILSAYEYMLIWFRSLLAKYLPGGIWNLVGRVYLCRRANVNNGASIVSVALETVLFLLSQIILITILGSLYLSDLLASFLPQLNFKMASVGFTFLAMMAFIVVIVHPKILSRILYIVVEKKGGKINLPKVETTLLIYWLILYIIINAGGGTAFYFFIASLYPIPLSLLPAIIAIVNLTFVIGFLTPIAPNGLGVREGLLALLLSYFIPSPIAVVISFATRIWSITSELISVGLSILILRKINEKKRLSDLPTR